MTPFNFNTSSSIRFGAGLLAQLGDMVVNEIGTRVLLVTDPGIMATGYRRQSAGFAQRFRCPGYAISGR